MGKIIKLTESDLLNLVKRVIKEQKSSNVNGSISSATSDFPEAKTRTYEVIRVKGNPSKGGQKIVSKQKLEPSTQISMVKGDNILMRSLSEKDKVNGKGKYFQEVELYVNEKGKFELFVERA